MADSDPDGQKKNPWQRRPRPQRELDIQQAWQEWRRQFSGLFGGNRGGGRPGPTLGGGRLNWGGIAVLALVIWAATGLYVVDAPERAVVLRFGRYVQTTEQGLHWHWPWPIEAKYIVNVARNESIEHKTHMLTSDENLVNITIAVQFLRADPTDFLFNVRDPEETLRDVSESAIREIVGQSTLEAVLGPGRQIITDRTRTLVQNTLNNYQAGVDILTVNLTAVNVPDPVAPAQRDAIKAREDRDRYTQEAAAYANDILPRAQGQAARKIEDAQAYTARVAAEAEGSAARFTQVRTEYEKAPKVTRDRLYLETVEEVLARSRKVLVDTKSGGNILYLPLDKLLEGKLDAGQAATMTGEGGVPTDGMVVAPEDTRARGRR